jgi:hypothetical protein
LALLAVLLAVAGCDRPREVPPVARPAARPADEPADGPDIMLQKPTEQDVRTKVSSRSQPWPPVEVLSPVLEVPESYFTRTGTPVDPAAVACYVAVWPDWSSVGKPAGTPTVQLVVVGRDSGKSNPRDRGKFAEYPVTEERAVKDVFGPDWLAKHPWPKAPEKD